VNDFTAASFATRQAGRSTTKEASRMEKHQKTQKQQKQQAAKRLSDLEPRTSAQDVRGGKLSMAAATVRTSRTTEDVVFYYNKIAF